jgi:hypothetical protein
MITPNCEADEQSAHGQGKKGETKEVNRATAFNRRAKEPRDTSSSG